MMNASLILSGLYDQTLSRRLLQNKELGLGFDFRPKSFNFLQQHKFNELLSDLASSSSPIFMRFSNEKQFLIQKFIDDIEKKLGHMPSNIFLEMSGELDFIPESFKLSLPIYYHLRLAEPSIPDYLVPNLRGVIIDDLYELIHREEELMKCIKRLHSLYPWLANLEMGLKVDWPSDISFSWLQTLGIKFFYVEINHYVEDGYRQVNQSKLAAGLKYFLSQDQSLGLMR